MNCTLSTRELDGIRIKQGRQCIPETSLYQTLSFLAVTFWFHFNFPGKKCDFSIPPSVHLQNLSFFFCCLFVTFEFYLLAVNNILAFPLVMLTSTCNGSGKPLSFMYPQLWVLFYTLRDTVWGKSPIYFPIFRFELLEIKYPSLCPLDY